MDASTEPIWAVTREKLDEAVRRLVDAARPQKIILFGSRARGDAVRESDVDLLVIEKEIFNRVDEIVRLTRVLRGLVLPVELLVISETMFADWSETPGNVYYEESVRQRFVILAGGGISPGMTRVGRRVEEEGLFSARKTRLGIRWLGV